MHFSRGCSTVQVIFLEGMSKGCVLGEWEHKAGSRDGGQETVTWIDPIAGTPLILPTSSLPAAPFSGLSHVSSHPMHCCWINLEAEHLLSHSPAQPRQWLPTSCSLKYKWLRATTGLNIPPASLPPPPSPSSSQTGPVPTPQTWCLLGSLPGLTPD